MIGDLLARAVRPFPYFRGRQRVLDSLLPREGVRMAVVNGAVMELDLADLIQRNIYMGSYEPAETARFANLLEPGMTVVDVGANIGYYTLLAARSVGPEGKVLALEPSPIFAKLSRSVGTLRSQNVTCLNLAASATEGRLRLFLPPASYQNFDPSVVAYTEGMTETEVECRPLDAVLADQGLDRVDALKIDVEGHEPAVVEGAARALAEGRIGWVLCEFHDGLLHQAGSSSSALLDLFAQHGYRPEGSVPPLEGACVNLILRRA